METSKDDLPALFDKVIEQGPILTAWEISQTEQWIPQHTIRIAVVSAVALLILMLLPIVFAAKRRDRVALFSSISHVLTTLVTIALVIIMPSIIIELIGRSFALAGKSAMNASEQLTKSISGSVNQFKEVASNLKPPALNKGGAKQPSVGVSTGQVSSIQQPNI